MIVVVSGSSWSPLWIVGSTGSSTGQTGVWIYTVGIHFGRLFILISIGGHVTYVERYRQNVHILLAVISGNCDAAVSLVELGLTKPLPTRDNIIEKSSITDRYSIQYIIHETTLIHVATGILSLATHPMTSSLIIKKKNSLDFTFFEIIVFMSTWYAMIYVEYISSIHTYSMNTVNTAEKKMSLGHVYNNKTFGNLPIYACTVLVCLHASQ